MTLADICGIGRLVIGTPAACVLEDGVAVAAAGVCALAVGVVDEWA